MASRDVFLRHVLQWTAAVPQIKGYPGVTDNTPVSAVWRYSCIEHITQKKWYLLLQAAVVSIGEDIIGIKKADVGTHSIRSDVATVIYLRECPVYTILTIRQWSSNAFLGYIRKPVERFSHSVSQKMLKFQFHRHISNLEP